MQSRIKGGLFQGVDFLAVLYYLLLVAAGWVRLPPRGGLHLHHRRFVR